MVNMRREAFLEKKYYILHNLHFFQKCDDKL